MHPIEEIMKTTMSELKGMIDANTVVGQPFIAPDGSTVIPISKLSFGFVSGGGEYGTKKQTADYPFAGGAASGISVSPVAFMVGKDGDNRLIAVSERDTLDRIFENAPAMLGEIKEFMLGVLKKEEGKNEKGKKNIQKNGDTCACDDFCFADKRKG